MSIHLFILCPPFCGSTLLWKLVSTSPSVSSFTKEGQFLPEVKDVMRRDPWEPGSALPWPRIRRVWNRHWDHNKPVLLEKSPPNLIRTHEILAHFIPARFLIMVRNPYAHCEGLIRREKYHDDAEGAARFALQCLSWQKQNAQAHAAISLTMTYEQLTSETAKTVDRVIDWLPQVADMRSDMKFRLRCTEGVIERPIVNLNPDKIARLTPGQMAVINQVLKTDMDALRYWGYELIDG